MSATRQRLARVTSIVALALLLSGCLVVTGSPAAPSTAPMRTVLGVSYGPRSEQLLDLYLPTQARRPLPVIVYFHAGGWVAGARTDIPDLVSTLAADTGSALVSVDYRLTTRDPDGHSTNAFPTALEDADRAVRWVRAHAAEWDLDPSMVIAAGASAGGQLAALLGVAPGAHVDPDLEPDLASTSPVVQGVLDYVGPTDFATFPLAGGWAAPLTAFYLDCPGTTGTNCDPAVVKDASVATHLTSAAPPAFLEYGALDTLVVPATQGLPLALAWTAARGELGKEPLFTRGVWYEPDEDAGHNLTLATSHSTTMELWLRFVLAGALR